VSISLYRVWLTSLKESNMGMVIDLGRRLIKVSDAAELHFGTDDSFFYLRVIALVAQKMKDRPVSDPSL